MQIALINFCPEYDNIHANLSAIERQVRELSINGVRLVCYPEMCLTGYRSSADILDFAQRIDGSVIQYLTRLAKETNIAIVVGMPEWEPQRRKIYNTQVCCTPDGHVFPYRKTHLSVRETYTFHAGDTLGIFNYLSFTFGQQLCYDAHFPEFNLAQVMAGAQVILVCSASPMGSATELRERWLHYLPARAYDTGSYVLTCNQHGKALTDITYSGLAMVFDPDGDLVAESREVDDPLVVDLNLDCITQARQRRFFLAFRRPELYQLWKSPAGRL